MYKIINTNLSWGHSPASKQFPGLEDPSQQLCHTQLHMLILTEILKINRYKTYFLNIYDRFTITSIQASFEKVPTSV